MWNGWGWRVYGNLIPVFVRWMLVLMALGYPLPVRGSPECSIGFSVLRLEEPMPQVGAKFGRTVVVADINGDDYSDIIAAANGATVGDVQKAGRVQIFLGSDPLDQVADFTLIEPTAAPSNNFGRFLTAGDINGDGFDDLIVPAFLANVDDLVDAGKVYVFLGGNSFDTVADFTLTQPEIEAFAHFGAAAAVGDINNDGYGDLIVGAPLADVQGVHDAGKALVFLGGDPFDAEADFALAEPMLETYPESGPEFGRGIATGDINGDGFSDVIVAASYARIGDFKWAGRAQVFLGGDPFDAGPDFMLTEPMPKANTNFGRTVTTGDINSDGFDEIIIGAAGQDRTSGPLHGRVQVFLGSNVFDPTADHTLIEPSPESGAQFGRDGIALGDINGDGYDDIVIGATNADPEGVVDAGRAQIFFGGAGFDTQADLTLTPPVVEPGTVFGASVEVGSLGSEHYSDIVIVGAPGYPSLRGVGGAGTVFVFSAHRRFKLYLPYIKRS